MLLIGFIPFFTFALGTWQLQRLQWKIALIDELEEKLQLQPLSLPEKIKYDPMVSNFLSDCISYYQSVRDP
jgi:surfeit locus 1 family protein